MTPLEYRRIIDSKENERRKNYQLPWHKRWWKVKSELLHMFTFTAEYIVIGISKGTKGKTIVV